MAKEVIKNIIIVNDYDYVQGGASLVAITMANIFAKKNFNVFFFCGVSNSEKSILNKKIKVIKCREKDFLSSRMTISNLLEGIYSSKNEKIFFDNFKSLPWNNTVVFIHGRTKAIGPSFINASHKLKFKNVLTLHDYFSICSNGGLFNYKKCKICKLTSNNLGCLFVNCDSRSYLFKIYRQLRYYFQEYLINFKKRLIY